MPKASTRRLNVSLGDTLYLGAETSEQFASRPMDTREQLIPRVWNPFKITGQTKSHWKVTEILNARQTKAKQSPEKYSVCKYKFCAYGKDKSDMFWFFNVAEQAIAAGKARILTAICSELTESNFKIAGFNSMTSQILDFVHGTEFAPGTPTSYMSPKERRLYNEANAA